MGFLQVMFSSFVFLLAGHHFMASALLFNWLNGCPPEEDLHSCSCDALLKRAVVTCDALKSDEEIKSDFKALTDLNIAVFTLKNTVMPRLDAEYFQGLHVETLEIYNVSIQDEGSFVPFIGLENSLEVLDVQKSFLQGVSAKFGKLDHLKKLKSLTMADNRLTQFGNDVFADGPKSLEKIVLDRNDLKNLGNASFSSLQNLELLQVRGNSINEVTRNMLPFPATELETIDFSANRIETLPADIFKFMPSLETVRLNNNLLTTISEETWPASLAPRASIFLEGNPLICDDRIKWLCKVNADLSRAKCANPSSQRGFTLRRFCDE